MDTIFSVSGDFQTPNRGIVEYSGKILVDKAGEFHGYVEIPHQFHRSVYGIMLPDKRMLSCAVMSNLLSHAPVIVACKNIKASSSEFRRGSYWQELNAYNDASSEDIMDAINTIDLNEAHNLRIKLRKEKYNADEILRINQNFNMPDLSIAANELLYGNQWLFQTLIWYLASEEKRPEIEQQFISNQVERTA